MTATQYKIRLYVAETEKIIIPLNPDSILYIQTTWLSILFLLFSAFILKLLIAQTISLRCSAIPIHDHVAYFSLCVTSKYGNNLFISSPLYLLPSHISPSQILKRRTKHDALLNLSIWVTQYLLTYIQNFSLLLPPDHRNKYSAFCICSMHHILKPAWLHCSEADLTHCSRTTKTAYSLSALGISFLWSTAPSVVGHFCSVQQWRPQNKPFNTDYNVKDHTERLTSALKKKSAKRFLCKMQHLDILWDHFAYQLNSLTFDQGLPTMSYLFFTALNKGKC